MRDALGGCRYAFALQGIVLCAWGCGSGHAAPPASESAAPIRLVSVAPPAPTASVAAPEPLQRDGEAPVADLNPTAQREAEEFGQIGLLNPPGRGSVQAPPATSQDDAVPQTSVHAGAVRSVGRLPAAVIQRVVQQDFGRFRICYENALRAEPKLAGRLTVRFTIDRSGSVPSVTQSSSDLASPSMRQCVVRGFATLSFPQPESGTVTVDYSVHFATPAKPPK